MQSVFEIITKLIASKHYFCKEFFCNNFGRIGTGINSPNNFIGRQFLLGKLTTKVCFGGWLKVTSLAISR